MEKMVLSIRLQPIFSVAATSIYLTYPGMVTSFWMPNKGLDSRTRPRSAPYLIQQDRSSTYRRDDVHKQGDSLFQGHPPKHEKEREQMFDHLTCSRSLGQNMSAVHRQHSSFKFNLTAHTKCSNGSSISPGQRQRGIHPRWQATNTRCVVFRAPARRIIFRRWVLTVLASIYSFLPISSLVKPRASKAKTSSSRADKKASESGSSPWPSLFSSRSFCISWAVCIEPIW